MSKHEGSSYKFDISRLTCEKFDQLMKTLQAKCKSDITGLGFTLDLLEQTRRKAQNTEKSGSRGDKLAAKRNTVPVSLEASVVYKRKNVTRNILGTVAQILTKTESIDFLKFRSLPIKITDLDMLSDGIYACDTLRSLHLCDIPLGDAGFERLARSFRKMSIVDLQLRQCHLTDGATSAMSALLGYHVFIQQEAEWKASLSGSKSMSIVCIHTLDLRDNEFTYKFIDGIIDTIQDLPMKSLDLRGNTGITQEIARNLMKCLPNTKVQIGQSKLPKSPVIKRIIPTRSRPVSALSSLSKSKPTHIQLLEEENEQLQTLIDYLKSGEGVTELEQGLLVIGNRSEELVDHIRNLDRVLVHANSGPSPFLLESRMNSSSGSSNDNIRPKKSKKSYK